MPLNFSRNALGGLAGLEHESSERNTLKYYGALERVRVMVELAIQPGDGGAHSQSCRRMVGLDFYLFLLPQNCVPQRPLRDAVPYFPSKLRASTTCA
jgi:hypothetical protein